MMLSTITDTDRRQGWVEEHRFEFVLVWPLANAVKDVLERHDLPREYGAYVIPLGSYTSMVDEIEAQCGAFL